MRRIANSLAALLALLVFAAPLSASACDLSCWLQSRYPGCHTSGSRKSGQAESMSMPDGMNMPIPMDMENATPEADLHAAMRHSMFPPDCLGEACRQAWESGSTAPDLHGLIRVTPGPLLAVAARNFVLAIAFPHEGIRSRAPAIPAVAFPGSILRI